MIDLDETAEATVARLAALRGLDILDTAPEPAFDDAVLLATTLCEAPVALVSLVADDRQWFKARVGFPACQTPLDQSVCKFVLAEPDLLVIPDLRLDPRTAENPLVTGDPLIRFYAGAPILDPAGVAVGSLCVIDTTPRPQGLTGPQRAGLSALARQVTALLGARRALREQRRLQELEQAHLAGELVEERRTGQQRELTVAVLAHDLRNPLAALGAGLNIIGRDSPGPRTAAVAPMMREAVERMSELVDSTLDFARIRLGGGLRLRDEAAVDLGPALRQVVSELQAAHPAARIETALTLERPVRCDAARISQMLSNLLVNAITHGDAAHPIRVEGGTSGDRFVLAVANAGSPIPAERAAGLFEPFARGDGATPPQGLGLGLYVAAEIARAHGGTLGVASTPQETRFTFELGLDPR